MLYCFANCKKLIALAAVEGRLRLLSFFFCCGRLYILRPCLRNWFDLFRLSFPITRKRNMPSCKVNQGHPTFLSDGPGDGHFRIIRYSRIFWDNYNESRISNPILE